MRRAPAYMLTPNVRARFGYSTEEVSDCEIDQKIRGAPVLRYALSVLQVNQIAFSGESLNNSAGWRQ